MKKSPLATVKERFESKEGLVKAVRALATEDLFHDGLNEDGGLDIVSNRKLLRLHDVLTAVKQEHGSREGLISAIAKLDKREKDEGFRASLAEQSTPRLYDHYKAAQKRAKKAN